MHTWINHMDTYDEDVLLPELTGELTFEEGDFIDEDRWEPDFDYEVTCQTIKTGSVPVRSSLRGEQKGQGIGVVKVQYSSQSTTQRDTEAIAIDATRKDSSHTVGSP